MLAFTTEENTTMATIAHDPKTGWGFTVGTRPYVGYTTHDAAAEALYDLEHSGTIYGIPAEGAPTQISPSVPSVIGKIDTYLNGIAPDRQDLAILGLECLAFAGTDRPLPEHLKSAQLGATYELARQRSLAQAQTEQPAARNLDDDPICTILDDGGRSGVRLERYDRPSGESGWLDFRIGDEDTERVLVSTYLYGSTHQGIELIIAGNAINDDLDDVWTLADLRRLRDDLTVLLADERLAAALGEPPISPPAARQEAIAYRNHRPRDDA